MFSLFSRMVMAFAIACVCMFGPVSTAASAQTVRKSINQFSAAELASLRRGMAVMISRNSAPRGSANYRRSWIYWANMHAYYGTDCKGALPTNVPGLEGLQNWTASTTDEKLTWCKCTHGNDYFLAWHRMYLYYFQRVLRQAANDPNLTLPYWDYQGEPLLPAAYRAPTYVDDAGATVANPLYVAARSAALNAGTAGVAASASSSANAMLATDHTTFRTRLESTPHGTIHCALGVGGCKTGLMGIVPSSALDPIFTTHHVNIDRLYECWLEVSPSTRLPSNTTILDTYFYFPDADGKIVKRKVRDMLTLTQLGYSYASGAGCPATATTASAAVAAAASPASSASTSTELQRGTTSVTMGVESEVPANAAAAKSSTSAGTTAPVAGSALVVIEGVNAAKTPGAMYNVFLANAKGDREQIGVISFFGFDGTEELAAAAGGAHSHAASEGLRFEFDATAAVAKLGLKSTKNPILIFEPSTGLTDSTVAKATARIGKGDKVSFRQAYLRVRQN